MSTLPKLHISKNHLVAKAHLLHECVGNDLALNHLPQVLTVNCWPLVLVEKVEGLDRHTLVPLGVAPPVTVTTTIITFYYAIPRNLYLPQLLGVWDKFKGYLFHLLCYKHLDPILF